MQAEKEEIVKFVKRLLVIAVLVICIILYKKNSDFEYENIRLQNSIDTTFMSNLNNVMISWNSTELTNVEMLLRYTKDLTRLEAAKNMFNKTSYADNIELGYALNETIRYINNLIENKEIMVNSKELSYFYNDMVIGIENDNDEIISEYLDYIEKINLDYESKAHENKVEDEVTLDIAGLDISVEKAYIQSGELYIELECSSEYIDFTELEMMPEISVGDNKVEATKAYMKKTTDTGSVIYSFSSDLSTYDMENNDVIINDVTVYRGNLKNSRVMSHTVTDKREGKEYAVSQTINGENGLSVNIDKIILKDETIKLKGQMTLPEGSEVENMSDMIKVTDKDGNIYAFTYEYTVYGVTTWRCVRYNSLFELPENITIDTTSELKFEIVK